MKNHDYTKFRVLVIALGLPLLMNLVACDKGNQGTQPTLGYVPGTMPGIASGYAPLVRSLEAATGSETGIFRIDLLAPANPNLNMAHPKAPLFYSGAVAIQGVLSVRAQDYTFCYAPVGDYTLSTQSMGMMTAGVISGLRFNAVGPNGVSMILSVVTSSLYNPGGVDSYDVGGNRIGMTLRLEWVNGRSCGILQTY